VKVGSQTLDLLALANGTEAGTHRANARSTSTSATVEAVARRQRRFACRPTSPFRRRSTARACCARQAARLLPQLRCVPSPSIPRGLSVRRGECVPIPQSAPRKPSDAGATPERASRQEVASCPTYSRAGPRGPFRHAHIAVGKPASARSTIRDREVVLCSTDRKVTSNELPSSSRAC